MYVCGYLLSRVAIARPTYEYSVFEECLSHARATTGQFLFVSAAEYCLPCYVSERTGERFPKLKFRIRLIHWS